MIINNKFKSFGIVAVFIAALFLLIQHPSLLHIQIAGKDVKVDLAITRAEHERGLSGRAELKEDEGMLFVFDRADKYSFWMKDMNFPIDIIWLREDKKVVYIEKNATPESYPENFISDQNAKYVLEVVSGFSDKNDLKVGDSAEFIY